MIAENKQAKLRKLAELFRAKRNITLAERRHRKENTLALVKQFAAEARAKRAAAEQPQVKNPRKFYNGYMGDEDEDNMDEEDDDVIIPDELQSEDPEALANKDVPPFYVRSYYRIPNYTN